MTNIVQFKWTPPTDEDGYRAPNVHEAVNDAAVAVLDHWSSCSNAELTLAVKALGQPHGFLAKTLTAEELKTLYAAGERMWKEVMPERGPAVRRHA